MNWVLTVKGESSRWTGRELSFEKGGGSVLAGRIVSVRQPRTYFSREFAADHQIDTDRS